MPRNSSGTYSTPAGQPVVSGTTIDSTVFNNLVSDLSSELTDSASRSGKGGFTAPVRAADGTVAAPAHSFTSDTDNGLYRAGTNNPAMSAGGTKVQDWTATGTTVAVAMNMSSHQINAVSDPTVDTDADTKGARNTAISAYINAMVDSAPTAGKVIIRDGSGRAQVAAPSAAADIARLDTVTTLTDGFPGGAWASGGSWATNWSNGPGSRTSVVKQANGVVVMQIRATLSSGSAAQICTLPTGFRPPRDQIGIAINQGTSIVGIEVRTTGYVGTSVGTLASSVNWDCFAVFPTT